MHSDRRLRRQHRIQRRLRQLHLLLLERVGLGRSVHCDHWRWWRWWGWWWGYGGEYGVGLTGGPILTSGTVSIAASYQLPQTCNPLQIAQWNGSTFGCLTLSGLATLNVVNGSVPFGSGGVWTTTTLGGLATLGAVNGSVAYGSGGNWITSSAPALNAANMTGAPALSAVNMTSFPILNQNTTGSASSITGSLTIANTPLTTTGDLMTIAAGSLARVPLGSNGTFLGVSGGVIGYYSPPGGGTVTNTVGNLRANTMTAGNGAADVETLDQLANKWVDIPTTGTPGTNPASGYQRFYGNSSGTLGCLTSSGGSCFPNNVPLRARCR